MDSVVVPLGTIDAATAVGSLGLDANKPGWHRRDILDGDLARDVSNPPGPWHQNYVVIVQSLGRLREVLPLFSAEGRAKHLAVVVEQPDPAHPFHSGFTATAADSVTQGTLDWIPGARVVRITSTGWLDVHGVLAAVAAQGRRTLPLGGLRLGVSDKETAAWAAADPQARWVSPDVDMDTVEPVDSMDVVAGPAEGRAEDSIAAQLAPVDPFNSSPVGFKSFPGCGTATLEAVDGGTWWKLTGHETPGAEPLLLETRAGGFTEAHIAALRNSWSVQLDGLDTMKPMACARALSQLAASGVPLALGALPHLAEDLLGTETMETLRSGPVPKESATDRESASIDMRRTALRAYLPRYRGAVLRRGAGLSESLDPAISVLLASKRPDMVPHALAQVARQSWTNTETILILHGVDDLGPEGDAAVAAFPGLLTVVHAPQKLTLGGALNLGMGRASGEYLAKMDDDDWYGPRHLEDLFLAREYSDAVLVGSPVEFTYLEGPDITTRRSHAGEQYTRHVAGGTMFISAHDLRAAGGWRNAPRAVDRALLDAVLAAGGTVYRNHGQNYMMHRRSGSGAAHTWQADDSVFLQDTLEQWNGFRPAPQMDLAPREPLQERRSAGYRSWFSTGHHAPA